MMFASTGWRLYIALYADLSPILDYAAVALLLLLITATVLATTSIVERSRRGEIVFAAQARTDHSEVPTAVQREVIA